MRASLAGVALGALLAAPLAFAAAAGFDAGGLARASAWGFAAAVDSVGWVLVPQVVLAIGVLGLALQQLVWRMAGFRAPHSPAWLNPAVESALLLGMLGTLSGMVRGFAGLAPDELEPGPLVHALGMALRSSFVGFSIALVGVWACAHPALPAERRA